MAIARKPELTNLGHHSGIDMISGAFLVLPLSFVTLAHAGTATGEEAARWPERHQ
jgi:hypothetical protein